jgi:large subunit ribosomal protein L5
MLNKKTINKQVYLNRFKEYNKYSQALQLATQFPYTNIMNKGDFYCVILNFSFKDILFSKKRVLPFFLAMELLTNQKCIATLSKKDVFAWKLRRGMLVGCKVTLRDNKLFDFFDNLSLTLPRMEKLQPLNTLRIQKNTTASIALKLGELVLFYPVELGLGINAEIKQIELNFIFNTLTKEEKYFLLLLNKIPMSISK